MSNQILFWHVLRVCHDEVPPEVFCQTSGDIPSMTDWQHEGAVVLINNDLLAIYDIYALFELL